MAEKKKRPAFKKRSKVKAKATPKKKKPAKKPTKKPTARKPSKGKQRRSRIAKEHKAKKAPRRYRDIASALEPEIALRAIRERLEQVKADLQSRGIDARVRVHVYSDDSIDGEVLVPVPWGVSANDMVLDMEEAAGRKSMTGFWLNMGARMVIKEDEQVYRRFRGFNDVNTHYQAAVPANWSEIPLIVRKVIIAGMEKKYGRKVHSVYLRIHWSPDGSKPRNRG